MVHPKQRVEDVNAPAVRTEGRLATSLSEHLLILRGWADVSLKR